MKTLSNKADIDWFLFQRELEESGQTNNPWYGIRCKSCIHWKQYINKPEYGECKYFEELNNNLSDEEYNPNFKNPEYCLNCHQNSGCEVWDGIWMK